MGILSFNILVSCVAISALALGVIIRLPSRSTNTKIDPHLLQLPKKHAALFVFGDSLFDPGNNNYINAPIHHQSNFPPYGISFYRHPTGRFSDGRLIPDLVAEYAKLPRTSPYLQPGDHHRYFIDGANFASGAAGVLDESNRGMTVCLKTQVSYFKDVEKLWRKKVGDATSKELLSRAVFLFSVGTNDYHHHLLANSTSQKQQVKRVMGNLASLLKEIYDKGGRKFGFMNLPALGCLPFHMGGGQCKEGATAVAELHNDALFELLQMLAGKLDGFKFSIYDIYAFLSERMNNPLKYGFKVGKMACCGSGPFRGDHSCGGKGEIKEYELCSDASDYVFFDFVHPGERACQQFVEIMWNGAPTLTAPYNLQALFESHDA